MPVDLSICIVNTRTPELLRDCLQSIYATAGDLSIEVWVVNNTAEPESLAAITTIQQQFPAIHLIQNEYLRGFGYNQNMMMQRAAGRYLLPLNNDTIVQSGALAELVHFMDQHPQVGIGGPKLLYSDGTLQPSCRSFPNAVTHLLEASGLWKFFKGNRLIGRWYYLCSPHDAVRAVDWLTGACLIVRAEAARTVGYFDDGLFPIIYGEDIEWGWRMKRAGWQILFDPAAVIIHLENRTPMNNRAVQMYRGFYDFCAQCYPRSKQRSIRVATVLALLPRWLLARRSTSRAVYAAILRLSVDRPDRPKARYG